MLNMNASARVTSDPLVSVIIPSYRMGKFVKVALESVAAQSYKNWEVILVDDCGPEDGTREAVAEFVSGHPSKRVKYIRNAENVGCGHSRNIAIAEARGEFLALLDPDDFWHPCHLEFVLQGIGEADICFLRCRSVDEEGNDRGQHLGGRMKELEDAFPRSLFSENFLLPSSTVMRHDVIHRVGGFATREHALNAADWDFYLRCVGAGTKFVFLPEETCHYRRHKGAATSNYLVITRECTRVLRRNRQSARGRMRSDLTDSLHGHLCKLAYLQVSFRDWEGLRAAGEALLLKPLNIAPFVQVVKGLRNNWKNQC